MTSRASLSHRSLDDERDERLRALGSGMPTKGPTKKARALGNDSEAIDDTADEGPETPIALMVKDSVTQGGA